MPRDGSGIYTRPPGTNAVPDTTIESSKYNGNVADVETDLNAPRPIIAGGTGANNAVDAANNLGVVTGKGTQTFTEAEKAVARNNIAAAPFDALAYNGMQVNGSMEVSQENGTTGVGGIVNNTKYITDGWAIQSIGVGSVTGAAITAAPPPGGTTSLQLFVNTANGSPASGDLLRIIHRIEGYRVSRLGWGGSNPQPMTIGFWVWTTVAGAYSGAVINAAGNRSYAFLFTVSAASTWQYITQTIPGDTTGVWQQSNLTGLELSITLMAGTTYKTTAGAWAAGGFFGATGMINGAAANNFLISSVIALPGTQAPTAAQSPLIMRPYDQELATCQRYYQQLGAEFVGLAENSTQTFGTMVLRPIMRAAPTCSIFAPNATNGLHSVGVNCTPTGIAGSGPTITTDMIGFTLTTSGLTTGYSVVGYVDGWLKADARL